MRLEPSAIWLAFGLGGQALFAGRFVVQWLQSERARRSMIPVAFWYLSLAGGIALLVYAIHLQDPVFVLGQTTGTAIYVRNIMLVRREQRGEHAV